MTRPAAVAPPRSRPLAGRGAATAAVAPRRSAAATPATWLHGVALAVLAAPGVAAWSALVAGFGARAVPVVAVAAVLVAAGAPRRAAAFAFVAWLVAAPLLAGVPGGAPTAWPGRLLAGVQVVVRVSAAPVGEDPWALAAGLLLAGTAWLAASVLDRGPAFAAAVAPWTAALALGPPSPAVWQGGAIVLGAFLWCAAPSARLTGALALSVTVALASAAAAQAVAPQHRWFKLPGALDHERPRFRSLATEPTFGPLTDRRGGATMLEVESDVPLLWRMQALDIFDGATWRVARPEPMLPQPAAMPVRIAVRVRGLRDDLVVSPGRVESIDAPGLARPMGGEAWRLSPPPGTGGSYRVTAAAVRADASELRSAPPPTGSQLLEYTRIGGASASVRLGPIAIALPFPRSLPIDMPLWGGRPNPEIDATPYGRVAALARRITAGARTEFDAVERVQRYLLDGGRFRYTTGVPAPGRYPLIDFLLRTHAGYCQHFAGAAALLLRLAGIPTRVVAGFATGIAHGHRYDVRDVDAHDWIEVYFPDYGWVPFNPTPAADPAAVPPAFAAGAPTARGHLSPLALAALAAVALAAAARRARRGDPAERLARLLGAGPEATLADLRAELVQRVGPHTAALAEQLQTARFAPAPPARSRVGWVPLARALARDAPPWRAARLLIRSAR
jgi:transglutaminase-like putative cysteine protease